jgi:hypothetical protein
MVCIGRRTEQINPMQNLIDQFIGVWNTSFIGATDIQWITFVADTGEMPPALAEADAGSNPGSGP